MTDMADMETDRLYLRRHRREDFVDCAALWGDADVMRFISGSPLNQEESWARFLRHIGHWAVMGFGHWTVREKASDRFVGSVGFVDFRRSIEPSLGDAPEIGWILATSAQGQGFAIEAVSAATRWGEQHFGARETVCIIVPEHARSIRLAGKIGYRESRRALYRGHETIVFTRPGSAG